MDPLGFVTLIVAKKLSVLLPCVTLLIVNVEITLSLVSLTLSVSFAASVVVQALVCAIEPLLTKNLVTLPIELLLYLQLPETGRMSRRTLLLLSKIKVCLVPVAI